MAAFNLISSLAFAKITISIHFCVPIILLLTCLQEVQVSPLPTANTTEFLSTHISTRSLAKSTRNNTYTIQYPPTTVVQNTIPGTKGIIVTSLEIQGRPSIQPFPTYIPPPIVLTTASSEDFPLITNESQPSTGVVVNSSSSLLLPKRSLSSTEMERREVIDCFQTVGTGGLPSQIPSRGDHPVYRLGIVPQRSPVSTNKFYANLFLWTQSKGVWTHPYSVAWSKGSGNAGSWGMAVSHIDADQRANGPPNTALPGAPVKYFINPIGIQSIILSAVELGPNTSLTTSNLTAFSANAILSPQAGSPSRITFPLVQGMGFVTGIYNSLMPAIESSVFFRSVSQVASPSDGVFKYQITLEDNKSWLLYAIPSDKQDPRLRLVSNTKIQGVRFWSGTIQVAKNPAGLDGEVLYDASAGIYPVSGAVSAFTSNDHGTYTISWQIQGQMRHPPPSLLMFALPHHVQSFDITTARRKTSLQLQTTTKGVATAVVASSWTMQEQSLPVDIGFAPWTPRTGTRSTLSVAAKQILKQVAVSEINENFDAQTNLDSMYFSGKALAKFALIIYTTHDLLGEPDLATLGLNQLKGAFAVFATNQQTYPLVYDTVWNGVVSSGGYITGDMMQDFGGTYYNDHQFHYAYFVFTAAVIAYLDPSWLPLNKAWVDTLVRDAANPSTQDNLFPFSRAFDWYHGHSFAMGLFESADGKDEESSSEDANFAYAVKMWGKVTGDASMEARGNLMLSILARSFDNYFLLSNDNKNQPANFIGNKVTGILFENKVDHTTYFGNNPEYIQGIHMLPLIPSTPYIRKPHFIAEEWDAYFNDSSAYPAANISGWKGVLYGNLACIDPKRAWEFFAQEGFRGEWLDQGASRTWYMAFAAAVGGI